MSILKPSNGWVVLAIIICWQVVASLFFIVGPYPVIAEMNIGPLPEERFGYQASELATWLEDLGDAGRTLYQQFQLLDIINAVVAAVALSIGLSFVLTRLFPADHWVQSAKWLPAAVFVLEVVENLLLYTNTSSYPDLTMASLISAITIIKLILGFGSMLLFVIFAIWSLVKFFRSRKASG
ncbi:MAG: hypothetical protein AB8G95_12620 [Anaerolineae bacterium]